jgi:hypothetical protein
MLVNGTPGMDAMRALGTGTDCFRRCQQSGGRRLRLQPLPPGAISPASARSSPRSPGNGCNCCGRSSPA